jgi:hypothetical protein
MDFMSILQNVKGQDDNIDQKPGKTINIIADNK